MMNPANIMKIMNAKNKFTANHPKFVAFLSAVFSREMEEGTVIEITLTRPGEEPMTTNMKIQQSDLDLMRELQDMAKISKYLWKKRLHMLKYSYEKMRKFIRKKGCTYVR